MDIIWIEIETEIAIHILKMILQRVMLHVYLTN